MFYHGLIKDIRKVTHDRYTDAWILANKAIPPPYLPMQAMIDRHARNAAAASSCLRDARRREQKRTDQGDEGNVEEGDWQRSRAEDIRSLSTSFQSLILTSLSV